MADLFVDERTVTAAPADVLSCDFAETMPQLGLLKIDDLADMALAAAVLAHQAADPALGCL